jgi:pyruvate dehydrogenase E1 component alpha subunit/2-oxoisovalerate dehydrogenase E1 component alpha subunit
MVQIAGSPLSADVNLLERDRYVKAYRFMLLARILDDKIASLYRMGKISGGAFLGRGQEALSAAMGVALERGDVFAPLIRDAAGRLAFGETLLDSVRTFLGSRLGPMRGRDGNIHRGRPRDGILPMISHMGSMISVVNGALLAHRFKGITGTIGVTSLGDGGTSTGAFHEGLNQAAVERLPLVLVVANNQYAYSTPNERQFACESLLDRAVGYGVRGYQVDGTSLADCLRIVSHAVASARSGGGPQMIVATLLRLCGHGEHDDAGYIDERLRSADMGRDCMKLTEAHLLAQQWADAGEIECWRADATQAVEQTVAKVQREPAPDSFAEDWCAISSRHLLEGQPQDEHHLS